MSNISRLTLFALISSIENDLREQILLHLIPQKPLQPILGDELFEKCLRRASLDIDITQDNNSTNLITYLDFADSYQTLFKNKSLLLPDYSKYLGEIAPLLQKIAPIRNRVMHTRPLLFDDLAFVTEFTSNAVLKPLFWKSLVDTHNQLESNPSYVLSLSIPPPTDFDVRIGHNLPIPDFDETGFLGRQSQVDELIRILKSPYPVITILGEGGMGKTALALRVAYEVVDLEPKMFDYVVWTSSKTSQITLNEIVRIEGAIKDSVGLIQAVSDELGGKGEPLKEILEYLSEFKILLILDNLETVLDDRIRSFLQELPSGSKILITSRIGLGELEYRLRLREMENSESVSLLRALATARGIKYLVQTSNEILAGYCSRMKNNPGWIKWFVSAVQAGLRPEEVLNHPGMFLEFCMSNVYKYLSQESRNILEIMQIIPNDISQAELAFLSEQPDIELQNSLQQLLSTNMVNMISISAGSTYRSTYNLSELARSYLLMKHPADLETSIAITKRKNQLIGSTEAINRETKRNPYSFFSINIKSTNDVIVAKYLKDAITLAKKKKFGDAEALVKKARLLTPDFYEVYRIDALVNDYQDNLVAAKTSYEAAIELEPNSAPLRKWFGTFLLIRFQDYEEARKQFTLADKLDPQRFDILLEIARLNQMMGNTEESIKIIDKLFEMDNTSAWDKRKLYDLKLRYHISNAAEFYAQKDISSCVEEYRQLLKTYINCPTGIRDFRMIEKLRRSLATAYSCRDAILFEENDLIDMNKIITLISDIEEKKLGLPTNSK